MLTAPANGYANEGIFTFGLNDSNDIVVNGYDSTSGLYIRQHLNASTAYQTVIDASTSLPNGRFLTPYPQARHPGQNNRRSVVFEARTTDGSSAPHTYNLYLWENNDLQSPSWTMRELVSSSNTLPDGSPIALKTADASYPFGVPVLNDCNEVAYPVAFTDAQGNEQTSLELQRLSGPNAGQVSLLRSGTVLPNGGTVTPFGAGGHAGIRQPVINDWGDVAIQVQVHEGGTSFPETILAINGLTNQLTEVIRVGDSFAGGTVADLSLLMPKGDGPIETFGGSFHADELSPLNDFTELAFKAVIDRSGMLVDMIVLADLGWYSIDGDANRDGMVNIADLGIMSGNYGDVVVCGPRDGDFNGDGVVDVADNGILSSNFGGGSSAYAAALAAYPELARVVPEPAAATLLLLSCGLLGRCRRP